MSYENPVSEHLFVVNPAGIPDSRFGYRQVSARDAKVGEAWFRDAIAANPDLVIAPCRRAHLTHENWHFWGKEVGVRGIGNIDVLLVSDSGRLAIVETKLSYNPEKRRTVVAQVLEYALHLGQEDLDKLGAGNAPVAAHKVSQRLRDGDHLVIVAGDELDTRAVRLGEAMLAKHSLGQWNLALVDMMLFERTGEHVGPEWLMVPCLRGTVTNEVRHVIRLEGLPQGMRPTVVERDQPPGEALPASKVPQKGEFLAEFADPAYRDQVDGLLGLCRTLGFKFERTTAGMSIRIPIGGGKPPLTIGWVFPPGKSGGQDLADVTLGYQPGRASHTPRLQEALGSYEAALSALAGAERVRHSMLVAWRLPPEALILQRERTFDIIRELARRAMP